MLGQNGFGENLQSVLACASYASTSVMLTVANKAIFSERALNYPWMLLSIQSMVVCGMLFAGYFALRGRSPLDVNLMRELAAPSAAFTLFIFSNARAMRHMSLPLLSVIKSFVPMTIALVERVFYGHVVTNGTYLAMGLIVAANAVTLSTDIEYNPTGYFWASINIVANVAYVLMLRTLVTSTKTNGEKTLHNNLLLVCFTLPMALFVGEVPDFFVEFAKTSVRFQLLYLLSCLLAGGIGMSVFWVLQTASGSTLSFVGAANKILVITLGAVLFEVHISREGWIGVMLGVLASISFAVSKAMSGDPVKPRTQEITPKRARSSSRGSSAEQVETSLDFTSDVSHSSLEAQALKPDGVRTGNSGT